MSLRKPATAVGGFFSFLLIFAFVGVIGSCAITIGIWPGEIKLLAPFFCTDAQPDAFVVADTYNPRPGETVTNFSLYCMGRRGDATDHGFLQPFLLISVFNGVVIMLVVGVLGAFLRRGVRRRARAVGIPSLDDISSTSSSTGPVDDDERPSRTPAPPGSTAGPFVD